MKVHQLDVAIPLQLKSQLRKGGSSQSCIGEPDADVSDTMQFVMLTRRGNKQQVGVAAALGARFAPIPKAASHSNAGSGLHFLPRATFCSRHFKRSFRVV